MSLLDEKEPGTQEEVCPNPFGLHQNPPLHTLPLETICHTEGYRPETTISPYALPEDDLDSEGLKHVVHHILRPQSPITKHEEDISTRYNNDTNQEEPLLQEETTSTGSGLKDWKQKFTRVQTSWSNMNWDNQWLAQKRWKDSGRELLQGNSRPKASFIVPTISC